MDKRKYQGVIPAFYACYDDAGEISPERARKLARHLVNKGVKGLYVGGSSGECIYQSKEERMALLEAVMSEIKGECTVIAHIACNNTKDSQQLAAHAEMVGVDAIASIPPIYYRLPEYAIAQYWNDISDAAPKTDFIIYNIPQLAGTALTPRLFKEMRKNPRMIGVKNSSMPTYDIEIFTRDAGGNSIVFNGPDEQFISGRTSGAIGGIGGTYAVMPELFLAMDRLIRKGRNKRAMIIQHRVNVIIEQMCSCRGNLYAVCKEILRINEGLELGSVRRPMLGLFEEDNPKIEAAAGRIRKEIERLSDEEKEN